VGFDVLTTCQPSTVWFSRERLPAAAAQPAKVRQSCSATDYYYYYASLYVNSLTTEEYHCYLALFLTQTKLLEIISVDTDVRYQLPITFSAFMMY
jgi:hypothetical protein